MMGDDSLQQIRPGQLIADRYRLEEPIGYGAMGAVWRALHVRLESPVAIKLLNSAIADDPEMLERFLREARSAAAVRSSHVVQIFDYGVDRDLPYIAMELLVGEPLDARLDARGVLEPPELDKIFSEVARAVSNAHAQGVVHRDIKPANIFIAREGDLEVTKVLDFGIAKLLDQRLAAPVGSGTDTGIAESGIALSVPRPVNLSSPQSGAPVTPSTPYSWSPLSQTAQTFLWHLEFDATFEGMFVLTTRTQIELPEFADGFTLPPGVSATWAVETHGDAPNVDAFTGPDGYLDAFAFGTSYPIGPSRSDGYYTESERRGFTMGSN